MGMASTEHRPTSLAERRRRRKLGIVEAAKQIGIAYNSLKLAEAGVEPRSDVRRKIAAYYGADEFELWPVDETAA